MTLEAALQQSPLALARVPPWQYLATRDERGSPRVVRYRVVRYPDEFLPSDRPPPQEVVEVLDASSLPEGLDWAPRPSPSAAACRLCRESGARLPADLPEFCAECMGEIEAIADEIHRHTLAGLVQERHRQLAVFVHTDKYRRHVEADAGLDRAAILGYLRRQAAKAWEQAGAATAELARTAEQANGFGSPFGEDEKP